MKITIICVSDSDKHFSNLANEYLKRLGHIVEIINIKLFKDTNRQLVIIKETQDILQKLNKINGYKIALSSNGSQIDTLSLKNMLLSNEKVVFVIGGPYGYDENLLSKHINQKIAFGRITLPHGLAKIILLEQIYRINSIIAGKNYHY